MKVAGAQNTTWSVDKRRLYPGRSPFRPPHHTTSKGSLEIPLLSRPEVSERMASVVDEFQSIAGRIRKYMHGIVPRPPPSRDGNRDRCRTTVGLVVKGTVVQGLVVGSPAFFCRQLRKGDQILQIDGQHATEQRIASSLDPHRPPGSAVSIEYHSKVPEECVRTVTLCAITMQEVSERCSALKLMETLKEEAAQTRNTCLPDLVGKINTSLVKFLADEASLQVEIWDNFCTWQTRLASHLDDLETCMAQLYAFNVANLDANDEHKGRENVELVAGGVGDVHADKEKHLIDFSKRPTLRISDRTGESETKIHASRRTHWTRIVYFGSCFNFLAGICSDLHM